jgi:3-deoxy-D-manno-octulosonate 8-phosphate phosphatase (KDO 8-P phosphatase)
MQFDELPKELQERVKKIKMLILDVDGVLTDGRIYWVENGEWSRSFNVKDGYGLKILMKAGVEVGFITAGRSKAVQDRANFLNIKHCYMGDENKLIALDKIIKATGFSLEQLAFVGDDLFDIPVLKKVGFAATVPHAVREVKMVCHYVTKERAGFGAVREIADLIRLSVPREYDPLKEFDHLNSQ